MKNEPHKYHELIAAIIDCAIEVHIMMGNGLQEVAYQHALELEMKNAGISFLSKFDKITPASEQPTTSAGIDFIVNELIAMKVKAIHQIEDNHILQTIQYLETNNIEMGLLINFGEQSLNVKRLTNKKYK